MTKIISYPIYIIMTYKHTLIDIWYFVVNLRAHDLKCEITVWYTASIVSLAYEYIILNDYYFINDDWK